MKPRNQNSDFTPQEPVPSSVLLDLSQDDAHRQLGQLSPVHLAIVATNLPEICTQLLAHRATAAAMARTAQQWRNYKLHQNIPAQTIAGGSVLLTARTSTPTAFQISDARDVVTNSEQFCDFPWLVQSSWEVLKASRGQTVDFNRLCPPAPLPQSGPAPQTEQQPAGTYGLLSRIRSYARTKGYWLRPQDTARTSANG